MKGCYVPASLNLEMTTRPQRGLLHETPLSTDPAAAREEDRPAVQAAPSQLAPDTIAAPSAPRSRGLSSKAKSRVKAGSALLLWTGAVAALARYGDQLPKAFHSSSHAASGVPVRLAPAPAPASAAGPTLGGLDSDALQRAKFDAHGEILVAKDLREPYQTFLDYIKAAPGAQKTVADLTSAPTFIPGSKLSIEPMFSNDYSAESNSVYWNSTNEQLFKSGNTTGTTSPAVGLLVLLKKAQHATQNYGAYLARLAMGHPDYDNLENAKTFTEVNEDISHLPAETPYPLDHGMVFKEALNVTDASSKPLNAQEQAFLDAAPAYWNDKTALDFAENKVQFADRRSSFYSAVERTKAATDGFGAAFTLDALKTIDELITRGDIFMADVADNAARGLVDPKLKDALNRYVADGMAAAELVQFPKPVVNAAGAPAPAQAILGLDEVGPLSAP